MRMIGRSRSSLALGFLLAGSFVFADEAWADCPYPDLVGSDWCNYWFRLPSASNTTEAVTQINFVFESGAYIEYSGIPNASIGNNFSKGEGFTGGRFEFYPNFIALQSIVSTRATTNENVGSSYYDAFVNVEASNLLLISNVGPIPTRVFVNFSSWIIPSTMVTAIDPLLGIYSEAFGYSRFNLLILDQSPNILPNLRQIVNFSGQVSNGGICTVSNCFPENWQFGMGVIRTFDFYVAPGSAVSVGLGLYTYSRSIARYVPEPASWVMMIAGFGLAGSALRRRRAQMA